MAVDPFGGHNHPTEGHKRGDFIEHPRLGQVKFYKHDLLRQRSEVIDVYGMIRYVPDQEIKQCRPMKSSES